MKLAGITAALVLLAGQAFTQEASTLDSLARDVARVESVREIKDLQRSYTQLGQFGRWEDMAALFADNGTLEWGQDTTGAGGVNGTATGPEAIAAWLQADAGEMDGIHPGSLNTLIAESPLVSLSADGLTARGRWNVQYLRGDGVGGTRIQGGIFDNEYVFSNNKSGNGGSWKFSLLNFFPLYDGNYADGWRNVATGNVSTVPIIPYHFTAETAGVPIPPPAANDTPAATTLTVGDLASRISQLNDEDDVRNLQHMYGYYVDRRMWDNVVDLFVPNSTIKIDNTTYTGASGVRQAMERMGPQNLTQGILNEHPIFDTIVKIDPNGQDAIARGFDIGMIGDANTRAASWVFNVFRNQFVKDQDDGIWKIKELDITQLIVANYSQGWGNGGVDGPKSSPAPAFLDVAGRSARDVPGRTSTWTNATAELADLQRRLARAAAFDATENLSAAYGWYADDLRCDDIGAVHAPKGNKESPGLGYYQTPDRIARACSGRYDTTDPDPQRDVVPFHWRIQPVIVASEDGRSTSIRTKLLQTGTSDIDAGGFPGLFGFNGGMYHDQTVLNDAAAAQWKLWSITIDEMYWSSVSWQGGWAAANPPNSTNETHYEDPQLKSYPPDLLLTDPRMGDREEGLDGGTGTTLVWPEIVPMWFAIRNPVSGRVPDKYWPGCVPCKAMTDWALMPNGYQEPSTGPTLVTATASGSNMTVSVAGGPDEPVTGTVEVRGGNSSTVLVSVQLTGANETFTLPADMQGLLTVSYLGSDRLRPGRTTVTISPS